MLNVMKKTVWSVLSVLLHSQWRAAVVSAAAASNYRERHFHGSHLTSTQGQSCQSWVIKQEVLVTVIHFIQVWVLFWPCFNVVITKLWLYLQKNPGKAVYSSAESSIGSLRTQYLWHCWTIVNCCSWYSQRRSYKHWN